MLLSWLAFQEQVPEVRISWLICSAKVHFSDLAGKDSSVQAAARGVECSPLSEYKEEMFVWVDQTLCSWKVFKGMKIVRYS